MATRTYNGITLNVTTRQGRLMDARTAEYFDRVNAAMPGGVTIIQGSYSTGVAASANTHAGPGALDLKPASSSYRTVSGYKQLEKICRQWGGASWFRQWDNNYHVHVIVIGTQGLPSVARNQVSSYLNGRDGLVSNYAVAGVINTTFELAKAAITSTVDKATNAVSAAGTAALNVNRSSVIYRSRLKVGAPKSLDVIRYQAALWNRMSAASRQAWLKKWGLNRSQVADGIYGKATADLTKSLYSWLTKSQPGKGWTPNADEPGPALLRNIGFTNIK